MFPLRCVGGFQRTSRCEEELDVEMTSWGTVGAGGVRRVQQGPAAHPLLRYCLDVGPAPTRPLGLSILSFPCPPKARELARWFPLHSPTLRPPGPRRLPPLGPKYLASQPLWAKRGGTPLLYWWGLVPPFPPDLLCTPSEGLPAGRVRR